MEYLGFNFECFKTEEGHWYAEGEDMASQVVVAFGYTEEEAIDDFKYKVDTL